jgi:hypothetical protein
MSSSSSSSSAVSAAAQAASKAIASTKTSSEVVKYGLIGIDKLSSAVEVGALKPKQGQEYKPRLLTEPTLRQRQEFADAERQKQGGNTGKWPGVSVEIARQRAKVIWARDESEGDFRQMLQGEKGYEPVADLLGGVSVRPWELRDDVQLCADEQSYLLRVTMKALSEEVQPQTAFLARELQSFLTAAPSEVRLALMPQLLLLLPDERLREILPLRKALVSMLGVTGLIRTQIDGVCMVVHEGGKRYELIRVATPTLSKYYPLGSLCETFVHSWPVVTNASDEFNPSCGVFFIARPYKQKPPAITPQSQRLTSSDWVLNGVTAFPVANFWQTTDQPLKAFDGKNGTEEMKAVEFTYGKIVASDFTKSTSEGRAKIQMDFVLLHAPYLDPRQPTLDGIQYLRVFPSSRAALRLFRAKHKESEYIKHVFYQRSANLSGRVVPTSDKPGHPLEGHVHESVCAMIRVPRPLYMPHLKARRQNARYARRRRRQLPAHTRKTLSLLAPLYIDKNAETREQAFPMAAPSRVAERLIHQVNEGKVAGFKRGSEEMQALGDDPYNHFLAGIIVGAPDILATDIDIELAKTRRDIKRRRMTKRREESGSAKPPKLGGSSSSSSSSCSSSDDYESSDDESSDEDMSE